MDELALLKDFRLEDAAPNGAREHARAAFRAVGTKQRRRRRRRFVALAFVGAAILAGTAYGVVHELIVGDPAPEEVREQPARFGHSAELIPVPHPDDPRLEEARVAAVLDSSVGTVYLFSSPNARGLCASTWIEGDRGYQGRLNMSGVCGASAQSFYAFGEQPYGGKAVRLFFGRAGDGVERIALRFGSDTIEVPLTGRWFLAEFAERPDAFLSSDAEGRVLEQRTFAWPAGPSGPVVEPPKPVTQPRELARISSQVGSEEISLLVARASEGGYCQIVESDRRPSNRGCSIPAPKPHEIGVSAINFGGAPGGILLLVGPVGADIATLDLRYQNGRIATVPLSDGWALYEVEHSNYVEGRRPEVLVARDESGREIASKRLPWATAGG